MDAAGAERLARTIEHHSHWRQAQSVIDGRQPARDPDRESLVSVGDGIRVYAQQLTRDGGRLSLCKRLVNGVWESGTIRNLAPEALNRDGERLGGDRKTASSTS
jgi:hypothetical protein